MPIGGTTRGDLVDQLKRDQRVQAMYEHRKAGHYTLNTAKLTKTILDLQSNRKFPVPTAQTVIDDAQQTLLNWRLENTAINSRIVKIKAHAFSKKRLLDEHINRAVRYLSEKYGREVKLYSTTKTAQMSVVQAALQTFYQDSYDLETLDKLCDIVITDLTSQSFATNLSFDVVSLKFRPERNI